MAVVFVLSYPSYLNCVESEVGLARIPERWSDNGPVLGSVLYLFFDTLMVVAISCLVAREKDYIISLPVNQDEQ